MAAWQPPIPHGALCSRQVRDLGPAVALLGWCWDNVRRDGCLDLQLKEIAADMDESYFTIVKWWKRLQAGPFFTSVTDRGRSGYRVQFADEWIEWRILSTRSNKAAGKFELPEMATEDEMPDPATDQQLSAPIVAQEPLKRSSVAVELPEMVTGTPAYKVLNTTDQTCDSVGVASDDASTDAPARKARKPRKPRAAKPEATEDATTPIAIRRCLADVCSIDLDDKTASENQMRSLNAEAKRIWSAAQANGKTEQECCDTIRYVAGWIKRTVYPYSNGQPLTPFKVRELWKGAIDARPKPTYANGTNGHQPAERKPTPEETAAFAARYNPRIPGRTV